VNGEKVAEDVLADLAALAESNTDLVTLTEAHTIGGYSIDHLQRLVSNGKIQNIGRKGSPRIRRSDVPIRPGHSERYLSTDGTRGEHSSRRRIATSVITQHIGS
jgi:hypothetical protein